MTPKIEWCNWVFDYTDNFVNGVNPYDDGETWMK